MPVTWRLIPPARKPLARSSTMRMEPRSGIPVAIRTSFTAALLGAVVVPILFTACPCPRAMKGVGVLPGVRGAITPGGGTRVRSEKGAGRSIGRTSPSCRLFLILGMALADEGISRRTTNLWTSAPHQSGSAAGSVAVWRPDETVPPGSGATAPTPGRRPQRSFPQPHGTRGGRRVGQGLRGGRPR